jgi:hypothetical protein
VALAWIARRLLLAALGLALLPATAPAEGEPHPDPLTLVLDGVRGAAVAQATPDRPCPGLSGGTAGLPEKDLALALEDGLAAPLPPMPAGPAPAGLPRRVDFRTTTETFNRRYAFVLRDSHVYYRAQPSGAWARLPVPSCFDGDVQGISVDDDELIAIDGARHVFTMDAALRPPALFNWTERWGPPFWTGAGRRLPDGRLWSWSVISPAEDKTWTDSAGNPQPVGDAKVSHIWLVRDNGRRLVYMDPWLPADDSYEMCGPQRGRFRAVAMSAAASTVFVMNGAGAMFTRLYDFDMSGADSFFDHYSYEDQRGKPSPAFQLPSAAWVRQPRVPGRIRDVISIHKTGPGSDSRMLRVAGVGGFWEKAITARAWHFVATGETLGRRVRNGGHAPLAPSVDRVYTGTAGDMTLSVFNFNLACTPAQLIVRFADGHGLALLLHSVDSIRQTPRAAGLDDQPRLMQGTIEAPAAVLDSTDPAIRAFVARYLAGQRFTDAPFDATAGALAFRDQAWTLRYASPRINRATSGGSSHIGT